MLKILFLYIFLFVLGVLPAAAELDKTKTFQESIPQALLDSKERFFTITEENDLFGGGSDKHYTNGIRFTCYDMAKKPFETITTINSLAPLVEMNETTRMYFSLGQNLYTPEEITQKDPNPSDRPYAGFLYGSVGTFTFNDNYLDELEVTLGIVGPAALGEQIQKEVHEIVHSPEPLGWDSQLRNEPAIIISAQRTMPEFKADCIGSLFYRVAPHIGASLGNVYTHVNTGVTLQLTSNRWQATPLRVRPAMPGIGYFSTQKGTFEWSAFIGVDARAVARNIFLDGNSFKDSPSVNKKHFVTDLNAGFTMSYSGIQASYTLNWRSDEFNGQNGKTLFGAITLGFKFD